MGTKLDLEAQRQVTKAEAEDFAKKNEAIYFEISSKTGENFGKFQEEFTKALFTKYEAFAASITDKRIEKKKSSFWDFLDKFKVHSSDHNYL